MDVNAIASSLSHTIDLLAAFGRPFEAVLAVAAIGLAAVSVLPRGELLRRRVLAVVFGLLVVGEGALAWFHLRLWQLAPVIDPSTGSVAGRIAVSLWVESEKLFVWALLLAGMSLLVRRHRAELLPGLGVAVSVLTLVALLIGRPFTNPLPDFLGQYGGYLRAVASGVPQAAYGAFQGLEGSRRYFYNTWYMWIHPPLLFASYGAFVIAFVALVHMVWKRRPSFESTAYGWTKIGYLPLTAGMLLGFPWAIMAWQGESWWWSGKVNMSIMMWLLYTAYLHGRLYLQRRNMWRLVAALGLLSFLTLVLTYATTYLVPGAHSVAGG